MKQIRTLKTKKAAAQAATKTKKPTKQLDEATIKEVILSFIDVWLCFVIYMSFYCLYAVYYR